MYILLYKILIYLIIIRIQKMEMEDINLIKLNNNFLKSLIEFKNNINSNYNTKTYNVIGLIYDEITLNEVGSGNGFGRSLKNQSDDKKMCSFMILTITNNIKLKVSLVVKLSIYENLVKISKLNDSFILITNCKIILEKNLNHSITFTNTKKSELILISKSQIFNNNNLLLNELKEFNSKKVEEEINELKEEIIQEQINIKNDVIVDKVEEKKSVGQFLQSINSSLKDFSNLLKRQTDRFICSLNSINTICGNRELVDLVGVITSIKNEDKLTVVDLTSIKDSNEIKIHFYNRKALFKLNISDCIILKKVNLKVTKNLDINIEGPNEYNIENLGSVSNQEFINIKKFRFDQSLKVDTLLSLISPVVNRSILKVSFFIIRLIL